MHVGGSHLLKSLNLGRIRTNHLTRDEMAQKNNLGLCEGTFGLADGETCSFDSFENGV
jgi:hypothetical protein